ncbi:MAG: transcriptional repressor [Phyllobacteriaceae bacterium]|jgi:Fur family zinc uptake transcriptional regulator|nr:transcriptional repressor [Phyllobacteriaceae bacterium]
MQHHHASEALTKNQALVMGALSDADGPLSAYTILDRLRDDGLRAPLQVYRALDKLVEFGLVHRLESLNAFVACRHPGCDGHQFTAFMICDECGSVIEIADTALARRLTGLAQDASFILEKSTVELRGLCAACSAA